MTDSNLLAFAKRELEALAADDLYDGMLSAAVLELVEVFANQGHSGMSAGITVSLLEKLLRYKPIAPLTGEPDEWRVLDHDDDTYAQNKRCGTVFQRADGSAFDINGRVFEDPDGLRYTSHESWVDVTFPYTPTTEIVKRGAE